MLTEEEKKKLFQIVEDIYSWTAPEAREWKFGIKAIEYVEELIAKYQNKKD